MTLRLFLDLTEEMLAASYQMMSMIIPIVDGLQHLLRTTQGSLNVPREVMAAFIRDKFGDLLADKQLCAATLVDPRFKLLRCDSETQRSKAMDATLAMMSSVHHDTFYSVNQPYARRSCCSGSGARNFFFPYGRKSTVIIRYFPSVRTENSVIFRPYGRKIAYTCV